MFPLNLIKKLPAEKTLKTQPRAYFNHAVTFKKPFTAAERIKILEKVGLNVFFFPGEMVTGCDCLSDSGVSTMTAEQWASLHFGDECYGTNQGYLLLAEIIKETFGEDFFNLQSEGRPNAFLFHQARAAEHALFTQIGLLGKNFIIPSNAFFDTTEANIHANNIKSVNLFSPHLKDQKSKYLFKGEADIAKFEELIKKNHKNIPLVYLTITNNIGGGQPVSMANIKKVAELAHSYNIPFFFDACRFAENAWFIKRYEPDHQRQSVSQIVKTMFSYVDGFTMSFKKDGLANMGGGLFLKDNGLFVKKYPRLPNNFMDHQILTEGNPSYGGISGRDIMTIVWGLRTIVKEEYLDHRLNQVRDFGAYMHALGLPVLLPIGGHAVYLEIDRFFQGTKMKPADFGGVSLTALLLGVYGHRACELGNFAFGSYNPQTKKHTFPEVNFVRFAIPRLRYEKEDLLAMAEAVQALHNERHKIPGVKVTYGLDFTLRHFKAKFEFKKII